MAMVPFVARVMVDTFVAIGAVAMSSRYSNSASAIPDGADEDRLLMAAVLRVVKLAVMTTTIARSSVACRATRLVGGVELPAAGRGAFAAAMPTSASLCPGGSAGPNAGVDERWRPRSSSAGIPTTSLLLCRERVCVWSSSARSRGVVYGNRRVGRRPAGLFEFCDDPSERSRTGDVGLIGVSQNRQQHRRDTVTAGVLDEVCEVALDGTSAVRSQPVGEIGESGRVTSRDRWGGGRDRRLATATPACPQAQPAGRGPFGTGWCRLGDEAGGFRGASLLLQLLLEDPSGKHGIHVAFLRRTEG
jgi:hypothetical protein